MRAPTSATGPDRGASSKVVGSIFSAPAAADRWRPIGLCGRGGTAEVWHVVAPDGREAALKRIKPELRSDGRNADDCLRREHELLQKLANPHLVATFGLTEHAGALGLVLEYLPHGDLVSLIGAPSAHWLPALQGALSGLMALHRQGFAHGDIKARNVLFAADESVRLIDLTSARLLDAPAMRATPAYGLPEPIRATAREADCFALAVLVYELVSGRLPYGPDGAVDVAHLSPAVPRPADPTAAPLLEAAMAMLEAGGASARGLSCFADVIESVGARRA
jgi:serine/threonine protein kinase